ncbi:hypothetical protein E2Z92_02445 [Salmonella enterica subsp. enterica serovar Virchow]|nr:hypothetical protein [Salmonella enterica subsp. enterica serovar Virchow]
MYAKSFIVLDGNGRLTRSRTAQTTVLRWMWEKKNISGQSCRNLLLMNQDTFCHPRYDVPADRCSDTMETLLRDAAGAINDVRPHHPPIDSNQIYKKHRNTFKKSSQCNLKLIYSIDSIDIFIFNIKICLR